MSNLILQPPYNFKIEGEDNNIMSLLHISEEVEGLSNKTVHLWIIDLLKIPPIDFSIFNEEELNRAIKIKKQESKTAFLVCRFALKRILSKYLQVDPVKIQLKTGLYGKPYISSEQNNVNLTFNLSHCKNLGCIALTKGQQIGVDVELIKNDLEDIKEVFLSESELTMYSNMAYKGHTLYHLWTQKEAILKTTGHGFHKSPQEVHCSVTNFELNNEPIARYILNSFYLEQNILTVSTSNPASIKWFYFKDSLY